jgi:hypothetical protein
LTPFDSQTGGVIQDNGGDHYDATITGSTTLTPGITGDAAQFDGSVSPITTSARKLRHD